MTSFNRGYLRITIAFAASLLLQAIAFGQVGTQGSPIGVTTTQIPPHVAENIRAFKAHRPNFSAGESGTWLDAIVQAANQKDYPRFKAALETAIRNAQQLQPKSAGIPNVREDLLAVLGAIARGQWDLRSLPIHRQNHLHEKGRGPELIGLPGVNYGPVAAPTVAAQTPVNGPIVVSTSTIPPQAAENIRALRVHRPDMPSISNDMAWQVNQLANAVNRNDFAAFKSALEAAVRVARAIPNTSIKHSHYRDDVVAVLGALARGDSDLSELPIHRRNHLDENGQGPELVGLPGVNYNARPSAEVRVATTAATPAAPKPTLVDVQESARRLAEVSGFPIGSPNAYHFDPTIVGFTDAKTFSSAVRALETYGAEMQSGRPHVHEAAGLRRILTYNDQMNWDLSGIRRAIADARRQTAKSNLIESVLGVVGMMAQPSEWGTDIYGRSTFIPLTVEEQQQIEAVYGRMFSAWETNAQKFSQLDRLEVVTELKTSGARLLLQRELASIWSRTLFPRCKGKNADAPADLISISSTFAPGRNNQLICGDGSFSVTPKQELTNVGIRVIWTNTTGGRGEWYGFFRQLDAKQNFIVPACGDFSTLHSAVLMPTLVSQIKFVLFSDPPTQREITVYSDQGTQSLVGPIGSKTPSIKPERKEHLAAMLKLGGESLAGLQDGYQSRRDPGRAQDDLVVTLSKSTWKGTLPRSLVTSATSDQPLANVELEFPDEFDKNTQAIRLIVRLEGVGGKAAFYQTAYFHKDLVRGCVLAIPASQISIMLGRVIQPNARFNAALPVNPPALVLQPKRAEVDPWTPVDIAYRGVIVRMEGKGPYLYLPGSSSHSVTGCSFSRVGTPYVVPAKNDVPAELSEEDKTYLGFLLFRTRQSGSINRSTQEFLQKCTPEEFAVRILQTYVDAMNEMDTVKRLAVSSRDLCETARHWPRVRATDGTPPPLDPIQSKAKMDRGGAKAYQLVDIYDKTSVSQFTLDAKLNALNALSDTGLESIKMRYFILLRQQK